ncbi:MAG: hypothetical protein R6U31_02955 [bacterium]
MTEFSIIVPVHSVYPQFFIDIALNREDCELILIETNSKKRLPHFESRSISVVQMHSAGYGEAVNRGAELSEGRILIIANDDIIIDNDFISSIDINTDTVIVPAVYKTDGTLESRGSYIDRLYFARHAGDKSKARHITGSIFIIPSHIYKESGGFDENYFLYYEDTDLSLRIRGRAHIEFPETLSAVHRHSCSAGRIKRYFLHRNRLLFIAKNYLSGMHPLKLILLVFAELVFTLLQAVREGPLIPLSSRGNALVNMHRFYRSRHEDIH